MFKNKADKQNKTKENKQNKQNKIDKTDKLKAKEVKETVKEPVIETVAEPESDLEIMEKFANEVFTQLKNKIINVGPLNATVLIKLTTDVIFVIQQESSKYPKLLEILTGANKKNIAMVVIKMIILESNAENKEFLITLLNTVISPTIDMLIKVSKREIDLGLDKKEEDSEDSEDGEETNQNKPNTNISCCFPLLGL